MKKMKNQALALALTALVTAPTQAARLTDNALDLGATWFDSEMGFMLGAEGRPQGNIGLALAGDFISEEIYGLDRTRLRVAFGVGHFFGDGPTHYVALLGGAALDKIDGADDEAGWLVQTRYELAPGAGWAVGGNLTYADLWDGGASLEVFGRYQLNQHIALQASYTTDVVDDIEGDDRISVGIRITHDWL